MTLMDELAAVGPRNRERCGVAKVLDQNPELAGEIEDAVNSSYPGSTLSRVLGRRGIVLAANSIQRHRRGDCQCSKTS